MFLKPLFFAAAAAALTTTTAFADAVTIPAHSMLYSAEGTKLGRVTEVVANSDGSPQAVKLIYDGRFIMIPANTLTTAEKGLKTSLNNATLRRM